MSVKIRSLCHEDEAQWRSLWNAYLEFYESAVSEQIYELTFCRLLDSQRPQQFALVAEHDGQLVGLVHCVFHAHNWREDDVCYLQDLYVEPSARGTGVGHALIEAVYKVADENGSPSVYWMTQSFNENARRLYDRIGRLTDFIKYQR